MPQAIISRREAQRQGVTRYFSGAPCPKGHVSERMTSNTDCVACMRERSQKRYEKKGDEIRAAARARFAADYEVSPERFRERSKRNYWADPDAWKERVRAYIAANPEKSRVSRALSRTRDLPGSFSVDDLITKFCQQAGICVCGADLASAWQIDHIVPISRGGDNWPDNIQLLCPRCNQSKHNKTMDEWWGRKPSP